MSSRKISLLIFAGTALFLWFIHGNRLVLDTNDEGIYLEAARNMLQGQKPYVDFFGYMTPGCFWVQSIAFRLLGLTVAAGRLPVILYFSLQCALVYWIASVLASRAAGLFAFFLYFAFQTGDLSFLTAQHRWDSSALSLAAIALFVQGIRKRKVLWFVASGFVCAITGIFTPSLLILAPIGVAWLVVRREQHAFCIPYLFGLGIGASGVLAALSANGILSGLIQQMQWLSQNYSGINVMPYGSIIGGYGALFANASGLELAIRSLIVLGVALPAILPVFNVAGWSATAFAGRWREDERSIVPYLLFCVAGLVVSAYPRADVMHLAYVAPLPYALAAALFYRHVPARLTMAAAVSFGGLAMVFLFYSLSRLPGEVSYSTPTGVVRIRPSQVSEVRSLLDRVPPGTGMFVYPYRPLFYFLTMTRNPTPFSYLAPGMMTAREEESALKALRGNPPEWVLYLSYSAQEYRRLFPAASDSDVHFVNLESWIQGNYRPDGNYSMSGYRLMRRN